MKVKNAAGQAARYMEFLADYEFNFWHKKGASNANADRLSRIPPCAEVDGEPCQQCQKCAIGRHDVKVIQTQSRSCAETLKSGERKPGPPLVEAGEADSESRDSDCTDDQCGDESDCSDSCCAMWNLGKVRSDLGGHV